MSARPPALFPVIVAGVLCLVMAQVPGFDLVLYPLRLLATFIHEGGHAIAALASGGEVRDLVVNPNASGFVRVQGGWRPLILSAGYLGSILAGCALLLASRRQALATPLLLVFGGVTLALTVLFARSGIAWLMGLFWGVLLVAWALRAPRETHGVLTAFLGIQTSLNALADLRHVFNLSVASDASTDAAMMSQEMFWGLLPPPVWAVFWAMVAMAVSGLTIRQLLR